MLAVFVGWRYLFPALSFSVPSIALAPIAVSVPVAGGSCLLSRLTISKVAQLTLATIYRADRWVLRVEHR